MDGSESATSVCGGLSHQNAAALAYSYTTPQSRCPAFHVYNGENNVAMAAR